MRLSFTGPRGWHALLMLGALAGAAIAPGCRGADRDAAVQGSQQGSEQGARAASHTVPAGVLVAHALGRVDGMGYTNSVEALRCNHRRGFRWFEIDLALTRDAELIAFHTQHEKNAGMDRPIHELSLAEVRTALYRERYPIVTFADILVEARALGDVVLVTDTKTWSAQMLQAVERVVAGAPEPRPRVVLQAYKENQLAAVAALAKRLGVGVIFTLYKTRASDQSVVSSARKYGVVAVVASQQRFNPWLAEHLDAEKIPLLVHTVNEHDQIVKLARAGADGFYTDSYVPYDRMMADRQVLFDCGATEPSAAQLGTWQRRDLDRPGDYRLDDCAKRRRGRVELAGCGEKAALTGAALAVPPESQVRIELEAEAPGGAVDFWFELLAKDGTKRPREDLRLAAGERRTFAWDLVLASGSPGLETRLGLKSSEGRLKIVRLDTRVESADTADEPAPGAPRG